MTNLLAPEQDVSVDKASGVAAANQQVTDSAMALLYERMQQALVICRKTKVTEIRVRVPMHGDRFGTPRGSIETE